ncbi:hypothetical protein [Bifidobacterium sp.]|jgi:hypothetical protein|uniref:hypothetical protein n=1 Tax=Bifidobacterium sp. TaxID=41200 RepID=UPI0025B99598|nr:hypothetical protein [Bifidobacterium sp.]MCH4208751.1 hypothetical protein [Bifidobacterium sp.]MCI1224011.1 hypothetical protein [Bifidobacterium sp.]
MSESMGQRHIRITRDASMSVTRTEVEITTDAAGAVTTAAVTETQLLSMNTHPHEPGNQHAHDGRAHDTGECFDPSCCDAREKALIRSLRAYLRPQIAPDCLITRLNQALDRYCEVNLPEVRDDEK